MLVHHQINLYRSGPSFLYASILKAIVFLTSTSHHSIIMTIIIITITVAITSLMIIVVCFAFFILCVSVCVFSQVAHCERREREREDKLGASAPYAGLGLGALTASNLSIRPASTGPKLVVDNGRDGFGVRVENTRRFR